MAMIAFIRFNRNLHCTTLGDAPIESNTRSCRNSDTGAWLAGDSRDLSASVSLAGLPAVGRRK
jgi:hypothetical protein